MRLVRAHAAEESEAARYGGRLRAILALEEAQGWAYGLSRTLVSGSQPPF